MTVKMINKLLNIAQLVMFLLVPAIMFAPPLPPGPGNTTPVSVDNGIYFLIIAGVMFGVKKIIDLRRIKA